MLCDDAVGGKQRAWDLHKKLVQQHQGEGKAIMKGLEEMVEETQLGMSQMMSERRLVRVASRVRRRSSGVDVGTPAQYRCSSVLSQKRDSTDLPCSLMPVFIDIRMA